MAWKLPNKHQIFLICEFGALCLLVPAIIIQNRYAPYMFAFLWSAALYCLIVIRLRYHKGWLEEWKWKAVTWPNLRPVLIRFGFAVFAMVVFMQLYDPGNLWGLVRDRPEILPYLLLLYPILSALPQELVFCSFFFKRYEPFFGNGAAMVLTSAVVFAYAHVLYINPVAPMLSLAGGIVFATTYRKTRSLALVTIEHSLYGIALFLIGLGKYFYSGGVSG